MTYWELREKILEAVTVGDEKTLRDLKDLNPLAFQNILNQAKGKRKHLKKGKR